MNDSREALECEIAELTRELRQLRREVGHARDSIFIWNDGVRE